mmetsp:Transcript_28840/g.47838  ORF Transcript_28840/g.47838 Transcript_28840/m.47838 type:complete len:105 (+) Transcript_28840:2363-2677(+)
MRGAPAKVQHVTLGCARGRVRFPAPPRTVVLHSKDKDNSVASLGPTLSSQHMSVPSYKSVQWDCVGRPPGPYLTRWNARRVRQFGRVGVCWFVCLFAFLFCIVL